LNLVIHAGKAVPRHGNFYDSDISFMTASPLVSPCIKVCAVDGTTGTCLGCGRTLSEIGAWTRFTDAERSKIMADLPKRMDALQALGKLGRTP